MKLKKHKRHGDADMFSINLISIINLYMPSRWIDDYIMKKKQETRYER